MTSSVDSRVSFVFKQNMFKVSTSVTLEVQPVDSMTIADVIRRRSDCVSGLVASSPMVRLVTPLTRFTKPVLVTAPLPSPHNKTKTRPKTAAASSLGAASASENKSRPTSAFSQAYQQIGQGLLRSLPLHRSMSLKHLES